MFSPIVPIISLMVSATVALPPGNLALRQACRDRPWPRARPRRCAEAMSWKVCVAGDEVGLGIDLDQRGLLAVGGEPDQTFGGDAAGLLGGLGEALGAQPIDRGLHVAAGLVERRLAVHHARAGLLAQVLHHGCGNRRHVLPLSLPLRVRRGAAACLSAGCLAALRPLASLARRSASGRGRLCRAPASPRAGFCAAGARLPAPRPRRRPRAPARPTGLLGRAEIDADRALRPLDAVDRGARDQVAIERDGAAGVVIAGDRMADAVRIAIEVDDRDDRHMQLARLGDGDRLLVGVDDEHRDRAARPCP